MKVLIDTNIIISREDNRVVSENTSKLFSLATSNHIQLSIHPASITDIRQDKDASRQAISLSKLKAYPTLDKPPDFFEDKLFINIIGESKNNHDIVDHQLLYALYKNAIDFLITEDKDIHRKANKLSIENRVFNIDEAIDYIQNQFYRPTLYAPAFKETYIYNLNRNDPIFETLKAEYPEFDTWFNKISSEGRKAWIYEKDDKTIGAILIYKEENEAVECQPYFLAKKHRLKISTLKVSYNGFKIGELFIRLAIEYAVEKNIDEIYLTHFSKENDNLVKLIEEFGFYKVGERDKEDIFIKHLVSPQSIEKELPHIQIAKKYYPSFYDGVECNKYIIPILPEYHQRLFTNYVESLSLAKSSSLFPQEDLMSLDSLITEGNTIKKVYLTQSLITKPKTGDIVIFYRSKDEQSLTSIGIIENIFYKIKDYDEIIRYISNRSVYSKYEIQTIVQKPTTVIVFQWHFHFKFPIPMQILIKLGLLKRAPQSIMEIDHEKYAKIKELGGINERFTCH